MTYNAFIRKMGRNPDVETVSAISIGIPERIVKKSHRRRGTQGKKRENEAENGV